MSFWDSLVSFGSSALDFGNQNSDLIGKVASTGLSLYDSYQQGQAAQNIGDIQYNAANSAAGVQQNMYNQNRVDTRPYRDIGSSALYNIAALNNVEYEGAPGTTAERRDAAFGNFEASPGYNFRQTEGIKALDRSAASRGRLQSGAQDKAILDFGQGLASQEYGNYQNRLSNLAGIGQTATGQTGQVGQYAAGQIGQSTQNAGTARASGYAGAANARSNSLSNLAYMYGG